MAGWETISAPIDVSGYGLASKNEFVYRIAGNNQNYVDINAVYRYNLIIKTWQGAAPTPTATQIDTACDTDTKIVVTSGTSIYIYDIYSNTWTTGKPLSGRMHCSCGLGDDVYFSYNADFYRYNIYEQTLYNLAKPPITPQTLTAVGSKIFAARIAQAQIHVYDLTQSTWTIGPVAPKNVGVAFGEIETQIFWNSGLVLDAEQNTWGEGPATVGNNVTATYSHLIRATNDSIMVYDVSAARLANITPSSGFIDEKKPQQFRWDLISTPSYYTQQSAIFQWRVKNSATINTINLTTENSVTLPAYTLPDGAIEWRVSAVSTNGISVSFTPWIELTTIDVKPNMPTGLAPNGNVNEGSRPIQFSWMHHSPISTPQAAFEIQFTNDNGATWHPLSGVVHDGESRYLAEPDALPGGNIGWRVRTYNSDNVPSDWSNAAFITVVGAPPAPSWRSVETNKSRPLCEWISPEQAGFQLRVMRTTIQVFDTGETFGTGTAYRIPEYLPNGQYTFQLRVKNSTGIWSEWADYAVSINAKKSLKVTLTGASIKNGAALTFDIEVI